MKVCAKCRAASYCSVSRQREDWPCHKPRCKRLIAKAALDDPLSGEFARWQKEMGSSLYECLGSYIQLLDMSDLGTLTGEPTEELVQEMREWATKMKLCIFNPSGAELNTSP
ncbi:hypothetical protein FB45DRAFT_1026203 [Roridomyces roridus]|uniref:MYND-type domain-containing protein n=1 Tax=Roridomyces roridus TaxID=1738132 RepID=A0AAD7FP65_9AGAR|nr:hypothetical protein FB45DRAFT_1026203 [Roridomyces roridus]